MLDGEFEYLDALPVLGDVSLYVVAFREVLGTERQEGVAPHGVVGDASYAPEADHRREAQPPFALVPGALAEHGEACLVGGVDGVDLVARARAVEVDPAVLEDVVHRDAIGVAVVACEREDATCCRAQYLLAGLVVDLLLEPSHLPEHGLSCVCLRPQGVPRAPLWAGLSAGVWLSHGDGAWGLSLGVSRVGLA